MFGCVGVSAWVLWGLGLVVGFVLFGFLDLVWFVLIWWLCGLLVR